jgi:hypothetical protein
MLSELIEAHNTVWGEGKLNCFFVPGYGEDKKYPIVY